MTERTGEFWSDVFEKLAVLLSSEDVKLVMSGETAFTSGNVITIPAVSYLQKISTEQCDLIRGYIHHEAARIMYTKNPLPDQDKYNHVEKWLAELIEDDRVEFKYLDIFFGSRWYLDNLRGGSLRDLLKRVDEAGESGSIYRDLLSVFNSLTTMTRGGLASLPYADSSRLKQVVDQCKDRFQSLTSVDDSYRLAKDIVSMVQNEQPMNGEEEVNGCEEEVNGCEQGGVNGLGVEESLGEIQGGGCREINGVDSSQNGCVDRNKGHSNKLNGQKHQPKQKGVVSGSETQSHVSESKNCESAEIVDLSVVQRGAVERMFRDNLKKFRLELGQTEQYYPPMTTEFDEILRGYDVGGRRLNRGDLDSLKGRSADLSCAKRILQAKLVAMGSYTQKGEEEGSLDMGELHRVGFGDRRVFKTEYAVRNRGTAIFVLVDWSNSMEVLPTLSALCGLMETIGNIPTVKLEIAFYTTGTFLSPSSKITELDSKLNSIEMDLRRRGVRYGRNVPLIMFYMKRFDDLLSVGYRNLENVFNTTGNMGLTPTGEAMHVALTKILGRPEARKMLWVLSDGKPYTGESSNEGFLVKKTVERIKRFRVELVGVGIGSSSNIFGEEFPMQIVTLSDNLHRKLLDLANKVNLKGNEVVVLDE